MIDETVGAEVEIEVSAQGDAAFIINDVFGDPLIFVYDNLSGTEFTSVSLATEGAHFLVFQQFSDQPVSFLEESNVGLVRFEDRDRGSIDIADAYVGSIDYLSDYDYLEIDLAQDQTIDILVDSPNFDPFVEVGFVDAAENQIAFDDDNGGGLWGISSLLIYKAPEDGTYYIAISDALEVGFGGYILTVSTADPDSVPFIIGSTPEPDITTDTPLGVMNLYQSARYPFSTLYPSDWTKLDTITELGVFAYFEG